MSPSRRAGTSGPGNTPEHEAGADGAPAVEACKELGTMLGSELGQVDEEIERVAEIIAEAVGALSSGFDELYRLAGQQPAEPGRQEELEQAVSDAVRALQFEDIASQALAEARRSVAYLRDVAEEVKTVRDTGDLANRISRQHEAWSKLRRKAVLQKNLDEGSVDLF
ncbi:MAG: hypothetical protein ACX93N_03010 [Pseudohaliea sp.]